MSKQPNVERSTIGLRDALFDEIDALRNGNSTPAKANALSRMAGQVVDIVKVELEYHKAMAQNGSAEHAIHLDKPLQLGR